MRLEVSGGVLCFCFVGEEDDVRNVEEGDAFNLGWVIYETIYLLMQSPPFTIV